MLFDVVADNFPGCFLSSVATEYVSESVLEQIPQACDLGIDQSVVNGGYLVCTRGFKSNTPTPVVWIIICCGRCILDQCMFGLSDSKRDDPNFFMIVHGMFPQA
jgi:hypothetical protein